MQTVFFPHVHGVAIGDPFDEAQRMLGVAGGIKRRHLLQVIPVEHLVDGPGVEAVAALFEEPLDLRFGFGVVFPFALEFGQGVPDRFVVEVGRVRFLDMGAVQQEVLRGVGRGPGADHPAVEAVSGQQRNPARMVDVGVGQHRRGDASRIDGEAAVFLRAFFPPSLEHPAVQENPVPAGFQQVKRAGHLPHRAVKGGFHPITGPHGPP